MGTPPTTPPRSRPARRWAMWGFVVGFVVAVPAAMFALLSQTGESLKPYLVPGTWLLEPLADAMASWPGLVNLVLASVVNGLVYGAVAGTLAILLDPVRRR